ncbi:hypothetical protein BDZ91DRAFT_768069 [Kalaharituber pfeilii]|nr:hypothetical protein BDZ91DRAFT_768069 [Kalaharituber pfeilii]
MAPPILSVELSDALQETCISACSTARPTAITTSTPQVAALPEQPPITVSGFGLIIVAVSAILLAFVWAAGAIMLCKDILNVYHQPTSRHKGSQRHENEYSPVQRTELQSPKPVVAHRRRREFTQLPRAPRYFRVDELSARRGVTAYGEEENTEMMYSTGPDKLEFESNRGGKEKGGA